MSQKSIILKELRTTGQVTRNWALKNYISRLSAIMLNLRQDGMKIIGENTDNGDYRYILLDKPKRIIPYYVNGQLVSKKTIW